MELTIFISDPHSTVGALGVARQSLDEWKTDPAVAKIFHGFLDQQVRLLLALENEIVKAVR